MHFSMLLQVARKVAKNSGVGRPKKQERLKIQEYRNPSGNRSWRITGTMPDGSRVRQNFIDRVDAVQKLADLESDLIEKGPAPKMQRTRLTVEQLADAEAAFGNSGQKSIADIVAHYLNLENRAKAKGVNLDAALSFVESHYRTETQAMTILNAHTDFIASRQGMAQATKAYYEATLKLLLKADPNKHVHSFTVVDIEKILGRFTNANSKRTHRGAFSTFFGWAVRHHYCLENPCDRLDKLPKDMSQIAALSLGEAKRLLYAATKLHDGATVSCVAIGMFAGLRPSEIRDLKSEDILKDKIRVSGGKLRRKLKRSVPIPPVLAAWLKDYPFKGMPKGWDSKLKTLKKATKAKKWVQDIIRHTSITFQAERDKNEALTAYNNGTSKEMMDRHYRDIVDDENVVAEYWSLTPEKLLSKPPEVDLGIKRRVDWPSKDDLRKLVWRKPLVHAAKDLGVSDVALRKRCVRLGVELPSKGHWIRQGRAVT